MEKERKLLFPEHLHSEFSNFAREYDPESSYVTKEDNLGRCDLSSHDVNVLNIVLMSDSPGFFTEGEPYYFPFLHVEKDSGRYSLKVFCYRSGQPLLDISSNLASLTHMLQFINSSNDTRNRYVNVYALLEALYNYYRILLPKYKDGKVFIPYDTDVVRQLLEVNSEGCSIFPFQNSLGLIHDCIDVVYAEFEKRYERITAFVSMSGGTSNIKREQFKDWLQHGTPENVIADKLQKRYRTAARERVNDVVLQLRKRLLAKAEQDKSVMPSSIEQEEVDTGDRITLTGIGEIGYVQRSVLRVVDQGGPENTQKILSDLEDAALISTCKPSREHARMIADILFGRITDVYLRDNIVNDIALNAYNLDMAFMSSNGMNMFFRQARKVRDAIAGSGLKNDNEFYETVVDLLLRTK
jgi:hypothetical protein